MRNFKCRPLLLIISVLSVLTFTSLAWAHGDSALWVSREDPTRPPPVVDGVCGGEYVNGWRLSRISYYPLSPSLPDSALISLVSTATDLYVCISPLLGHYGIETPFVGIYFDPTHNGDRVPDGEDVAFTINEYGTELKALRGDGMGGFVSDPTITGWEAAIGLVGSFQWSAEFRIPLDLIGGGIPGPDGIIGFSTWHRLLRSADEDFGWPSPRLASYDVPNTWADLLWLEPPDPGLTGRPALDVARITQGLEEDISGGVFYDLIAGKDTFVRAQLYTRGSLDRITRVTCNVRRIFPFPSGEPNSLVPPDWPDTLNAIPVGFFDGSSVFQCALQGSFFEDPGTYHIAMELQFLTGETHVVFLGTREFLPSKDMRLFLFPWTNQNDPNFVNWTWTGSLMANLPIVYQHSHRMTPLHAGVGTMINEILGLPRAPGNAGLRYFLNSAISIVGLNPIPATVDTRMRIGAERTRRRINASLDAADQLQLSSLMDGVTASGGGQANGVAGQCTAGSGFDANVNGASGSVVTHEVLHCYGQVRSESPNSLLGNRSHSKNLFIGTRRGLPMFNMFSLTDVFSPSSVMIPVVGVVNNHFTEGWEWNNIRTTFPDMSNRNTTQAKFAVSQNQQPLFLLDSLIDKDDKVDVLSSSRIDDLALELTPDNPNGSYVMNLLDQSGVVVSSVRFEPDFTSSEGDLDTSGFILIIPFHTESTRVEIRKGNNLLYAEDFTAAAPVVWNVMAIDDHQGNIELTWEASDPDGPKLNYEISLLLNPDAIPILIQTFHQGKSFVYNTSFAPAASDALLIVEASDGLNTAKAYSNTFSIAAKPPVVAISAPENGSQLLEGQFAAFSAASHDLNAGPLPNEAYSWNSDQEGFLGTGEQIQARLTKLGEHIVSVTATAPSQLTATASVPVVVIPDSDGDGLSDDYESQQTCLSGNIPDGQSDPDEDMLTSLGERARGTDPCSFDSDSDGFDDGEEVRLNSDPLNAQTYPVPAQIFFSAETVNLVCPNPVEKRIPVQVGGANVIWNVTTDSSWLAASGGGTQDGDIIINATCDQFSQDKLTGRIMVSSAIIDANFQKSNHQARILEVELGGECIPPLSGTWTISSSCNISSLITAPGSVIVQQNAAVTVFPAGRLDVDFLNYNLQIINGSTVLIKAGGKID